MATRSMVSTASRVLVTDPRIQAWLARFTVADACSGETLSNDAPDFYPANCSPSQALITFRAAAGPCDDLSLD